MDYLIKLPLPIKINPENIAGAFQTFYDQNTLDGLFNFIKTENPDEFLVAFHRKTKDDFNSVARRVKEGVSLHEAIAQQLVSELSLYDAPNAIADTLYEIVRQLTDGVCEIQIETINKFTEESDGERPH